MSQESNDKLLTVGYLVFVLFFVAGVGSGAIIVSLIVAAVKQSWNCT